MFVRFARRRLLRLGAAAVRATAGLRSVGRRGGRATCLRSTTRAARFRSAVSGGQAASLLSALGGGQAASDLGLSGARGAGGSPLTGGTGLILGAYAGHFAAFGGARAGTIAAFAGGGNLLGLVRLIYVAGYQNGSGRQTCHDQYGEKRTF